MRIWRPNIPLPSDWPARAQTAVLHAIALAHFGLTHIRGWCENSRIERVKFKGQAERAEAEVLLLREERRIKDARMARVPPANRPHYTPVERMAILELKAARAWNQAQTARAFLVTEATIASWLQRLDEQGPDALVQTRHSINRYPDFVAHLVHQLKATLPTMGKVRVADMLARAGLTLSASTVKRMLERPPGGPPSMTPGGTTPSNDTTDVDTAGTAEMQASAPANDQSSATDASVPCAPRSVIANYPGHVWSIDNTVVPICDGLWAPWLPWALPQCWPFAYRVSVVADHFSRRVMGIAAFPDEPTAAQVCALLDEAVARAGGPPKYTVTDQGHQFQDQYLDWCDQHGVKPRFGALGQHGSIALTERLVLTLKEECTRRMLIPFALDAMRAEMELFARWYNEWRPHRSLGGRTPDEVYASRTPARAGPRFEPRARYPNDAQLRGELGDELQLKVDYLEGRKHLPLVTLQRAA
jgi:transposase InsO family protein